MNIQLIGTGCDVALSMIVVKKIKKTVGCKTLNFLDQSLCVNYVIHDLIQHITQPIINNCHLFPSNLI
jgi:hypothetical protein